MKLIYTGPHQDGWVEVDPPISFVRLEPVDVPDDVAATLIVQDTWSAAPADKPVMKES